MSTYGSSEGSTTRRQVHIYGRPRRENGRTSIDRLADIGIRAAPSEFYGTVGNAHVRAALSATNARRCA